MDLFTDDGVYELPFSLRGGVRRYEGISTIRERFVAIGRSPANTLYELDHVAVAVHESIDPDVVTLEWSISGRLHANGEPIRIPSSVAVVFFEGDKIKHYRDYPNSAGIAEAVGVLPAYAASLMEGAHT